MTLSKKLSLLMTLSDQIPEERIDGVHTQLSRPKFTRLILLLRRRLKDANGELT